MRFPLLFLLLAGCTAGDLGSDPSADSDSLTAASYQDVFDFTSDRGDIDAWVTLTQHVSSDWDQICGDTFCGGDYSNLHALSLRCSVKISTGTLRACNWVFAGSYEVVTASTGTIATHASTWSCHIPVSGMKLDDFMKTVSAASTPGGLAIQRPLPGTGKSMYDALAGCLP